MLHKLKIGPEYLKNLMDGIKKCEIRFNDRDYQTGDTLQFWDYSTYDKPKEILFTVTHVHSGLGMAENYVCLSVSRID